MKKLLISALIFSTLFATTTLVNASTIKEEILSKMPGVSAKELDDNLKETSKMLGKSEEEIANQILKELKTQDTLSEKESKSSYPIRSGRAVPFNDGIFTLDAPSNIGDIFYEPAITLGVNHGHVGIYFSSDLIVESTYKTGVRCISRTDKQVESGSKIFTLLDATEDVKEEAANWAYSRIGDNYSFNFATNRTTSLVGDKNCSKLVWSSYKVAGNMDIDFNGGLGVYPRDILNYSESSVYKSY